MIVTSTLPSTTPDFAIARSPTPFTLVRPASPGRRGLACWLALPGEISKSAPPLVAVHGIGRGAREQAELLGRRAAALGRPVVAPVFDASEWPCYQQVVRKGRADLALLALMSELRSAGIWRTRKFELAGYSGGAQFAHRFAMLSPHLVSGLTVSAAGWYTFPDSAPFPYGLGARAGRTDDWGPKLASGLEQFLRLPIQICIGGKDHVRDANTRSGPRIDRQQGTNRLIRATRWIAALRRCAIERDIDARIALTVLPGCGHDFRTCVRRGGLDRLVLEDAYA